MRIYFKRTALMAAMLLAACSSMPQRNSMLEEARGVYNSVRSDPVVGANAPAQLEQATLAFNRAEDAWKHDEKQPDVDHLAYLAKKKALIAQETARLKFDEATIQSAGAERERVRLEARTREADAAAAQARAAQANEQVSRQAATAAQQQAQQEAERARMAGQQAQQQAERANTLEQQAQQQAQRATTLEQQAQQQAERANALEQQLKDMQAKQTDRGMVVTLGDVLFDSGKSALKSGGVRTVAKLAEYLKQATQRKVAIEGFTDSVGADEYNQVLSERRAEAVKSELVSMGVSPDRISTRGYGKAFPVANNGQEAGRQLNRRVEVVISDDSGKISPRADSR